MKLLACTLAAFALVMTPGRPAHAREYVDLELVIATDVSQSIDTGEARLQREGIADAFRSKEVIEAISAGMLRRIAVAYLDFSSRQWNKVVIDWRIIQDKETAYAFARDLLNSPPTPGRRTSISDALTQGAEMLASNDIEGTRRTIDVSGDGPNNFGRLVDTVRDETLAKGIVINGLPIINNNGGIGSRFNLPDLDLYYRGCVIGGPGAFVIVANSFEDFARAIRRKLILEISGLEPPKHPHIVHVAMDPPRDVRPSPAGYTYKKGCDIGERLRDSYWIDDN